MSARTSSGQPARGAVWLPRVGAAVVALTLAAGPILTAAGVELGVLRAPFYVQIAPDVSLHVLPALALVALALAAAPRLCEPRLAPVAFAAAATALTLVLRLAIAAVRDGPVAWHRVYGTAWEAQFEYLPALPALRLGVVGFLDRFAQFSASLPIHPSAHPPGTVLALHWLGIETAQAMAALTIGVGALCAPLVYVLGRQLLDDRRARLATLFYAFPPSSLLYGATSADALFATLGIAAAAALVARRRAVMAAGGALLALASFFSYALAGVAAWAVAVVGGRRGLAAGAGLAVWCGAALVAFYAALWALTGFDLPGSLEAANSAYVRGISSQRPYWYWVVGSPTAFFVALGLPLAWLVARGAGRGELTAIAILGLVVLSALLGFTKAENERIWQFMVPLACVAAAAEHRRATSAVLAALAVQALVVEVLLDTRW